MTITELSDKLKTYDYVVTKLNLVHNKHCYLIYNDKDADIQALILSYQHNHIQWNTNPNMLPYPVRKAIKDYARGSSKAWSLGYHAGWENTKHAYQKGFKRGYQKAVNEAKSACYSDNNVIKAMITRAN